MAITLTRLAGCVVAGTLPLLVLPRLPGAGFDLLTIPALLVLTAVRRPVCQLLVLTLLFSVWSVNAGRSMLDQATMLTREPVTVEVVVDRLHPDGNSARVRLLRHHGRWIYPPLYARIILPPAVQQWCAGQHWLMTLRLRPVHAQLNQGGFDLQRFAVANAQPLTGKALSASLSSARCSWRATLMAAAQADYRSLPWAALITALAFGERGEVSPQISQLLRETGTAHLMAISGMHIGLAALFGWLMARLLQLPLPAAGIGYRFPLYCSLLVALIYCWLSGGDPPALRALLALFIWSALRLSGVKCSNWQVWLFCIALILLFDPLSILSASLWLSAVAVAALLLWYHSFPLPARFLRDWYWLPLRLLHLQLGMMLLLMPLQVWLFHGFSLSALLANIWAVPIISLLTVPLILLALLFRNIPGVGTLLWSLADSTLTLLFNPLQQLPSGWLTLSAEQSLRPLLCGLLLLSLRFAWWRSSPFTLLSLSLLLWFGGNGGGKAGWRLDMLDIGHGLAVVISRNGEAVLYDTGNRWPGGDSARSHILPWLAWQGLRVKEIIISHNHLDHTGGINSLRQVFPQVKIRSAVKNLADIPCRQGDRWQWQGLHFMALWPPPGMQGEGNNQSCVVAVSDARWRVLLTGDIEREAERQLVAQQRTLLAADLLQVPHHGSRTSSTAMLLRAVGADHALASAARYSRWRLPSSSVIQRYAENNIEWHDTALSGQLTAIFSDDSWKIMGLRQQIQPRWYHQWFGVARDSR